MKISLRPATTDDATILFQWQSNPQVRQYFHNPDVPDWGEHTDWVKRRLGDPGTILCMVMEDGTEVGVLRLDRRSPGVFTVSVLIDPKRQGEGIGAEALKLGRGLRPAARLEAEVLPGNEASHAIFKRAGYVEKKEGIYVHEPHGKTPLAVFRVNAGPHVGLGHAQRCLALATTLQGRGWGIRFLDAPGTGVGALAEAAGFPAQGIGEDEEAIAGAAEGAQILVVDHYKLDLKPLAEDPGRSWLLVAFDDSGKRPLPVDIVINGSPAAGAISYSALGAKRPLAGATYQILRKDLHPKPRRDAKQPPKRLLVTIGGGDPLAISESLLALLEEKICPAYSGLRIDCVTGPLAPAPRAARQEAIACHHAPSHMPDLLAGTDIAVSAAGQTLMELLSCGVPSAAFFLAENQQANLDTLAKEECVLSAGSAKADDWLERLEKAIRRLLDEPGLRQRLSEKGKKLIDGRGADRVADAIDALARHEGSATRQGALS